jgi:effector-binding domain-containing protein
MKSLLKILYFLLILVILILLAGLFLPRNGHIESEVTIKASPKIVFDQVNTLKNWENWSPWLDADSSMKISYAGPDSGKGATYSWTSEHSGDGKLIITSSEPEKKIEALIDFGVQGKATTTWTFDSAEIKGTHLTWAFDNSDMGYFERYFMILFRKNMLTTFNRGLHRIKNISERLRLDRISDIHVVDLEARPSIGIIDSTSLEKMAAKMADMYSRLSIYLAKRSLQPTGPPFTIYYTWNPKGTSKFACCLPIAERTWGWKDYTFIELPQGKAVEVTHWGKYGTETPYLALDKYLQDNHLKKGSFIWEVYVNDPAAQPDTSKWEMKVFYPVE